MYETTRRTLYGMIFLSTATLIASFGVMIRLLFVEMKCLYMSPHSHRLLFPGALLWDVGAGSGSIGIEWMRAARDAKTIAFENDEKRIEMISDNIRALGTPALEIVSGKAPDTLRDKPAPDAVFIGGDVANDELFDACWAALKPGGRLVANAVTLDGEQALILRQELHGGELTRIDISTLDTVGKHKVMRPRLPVTQWSVRKP